MKRLVDFIEKEEFTSEIGIGKDKIQLRIEKGSVPGDIATFGIRILNPNRGAAYYPVRRDFAATKKQLLRAFSEALDKAEEEVNSAYRQYGEYRERTWKEEVDEF